jgi:hydrogenase/urease accessory protein HupE
MKIVIALVLVLLAPAALAHKPSDSYLALTPAPGGFDGEWRIALRDLEMAVGLDSNGDRRITWGELRSHHEQITAYALQHLAISSAGSRCTIHHGAQLVDDLSDGAYTVLPLGIQCAKAGPVIVEYMLLFDLDPTHRGLVTLREGGSPRTVVLSSQHRRETLPTMREGALRQVTTMLREGIWHIWTGLDHLLFLLALLIPAGLRAAKARRDRQAWRPLLKDVLTLVTAFTVAHSITLTLATLRVVTLPPRLIETSIAVSIVVAGWRLRRADAQPAPWIAFGFGLVHGFGFANVLADMHLPAGSLALSLFSFNAGVEIGQCAIVAALLPLIRWMQGYEAYRRSVLPAAAVVIAAIGLAWSIERGAGIDLLRSMAGAAHALAVPG